MDREEVVMLPVIVCHAYYANMLENERPPWFDRRGHEIESARPIIAQWSEWEQQTRAEGWR